MRSTLALAAVLLVTAGCGGRQHLRRAHGVSYRESFTRQQANPQAGRSGKPVAGLDSQDAQTVAKTYRTGMAPKSDVSAAAGTRSVILLPTAPSGPGSPPPPSVPAP